jgi:hypothetical protein
MHDEVGADDAIARVRRAVREVERETHGRPLTGTSHDDADAVVGTIATDSAIGFDPLPVLAALSHHGAQVVVMGQVAGIMHGSTELTGDLDLLGTATSGKRHDWRPRSARLDRRSPTPRA